MACATLLRGPVRHEAFVLCRRGIKVNQRLRLIAFCDYRGVRCPETGCNCGEPEPEPITQHEIWSALTGVPDSELETIKEKS
jgi:hypothetical protein